MLGTTTATASTTAAPLSTLSMSVSSSPETKPTPTTLKRSIGSPDVAMQTFTPGQCLFCPYTSPSFTNSVAHMQKSHGLFVPQQRLAVDLETLFGYLHLVIFGYRECIQCGTDRATVQAVQQHMTGKGHCTFDISEQDSEFADFFDFSGSQDAAESDVESEGDERNQEETATSSSRKPLLVDGDSIRLPSGKIISRQSSAQAGSSLTQLRRRTRTLESQLEYPSAEPDDDDDDVPTQDELGSGLHDKRLLSKREKRERTMMRHQLTNMSTSDRNALMHLPASQQRSVLAAQHRHAEKVQKEEKRRQTKVDRKGNKNLYAYWHTETPVYQCG